MPDLADPFAAIQAALRQWRAEHPRATLAEIEAQVDTALSTVRSQTVADLALTGVEAAAPACPTCGRSMQRHGQRPRHLVTRDEGQVILPLPRYRCPVCATELPPP